MLFRRPSGTGGKLALRLAGSLPGRALSTKRAFRIHPAHVAMPLFAFVMCGSYGLSFIMQHRYDQHDVRAQDVSRKQRSNHVDVEEEFEVLALSCTSPHSVNPNLASATPCSLCVQRALFAHGCFFTQTHSLCCSACVITHPSPLPPTHPPTHPLRGLSENASRFQARLRAHPRPGPPLRWPLR